MGSAAAAPVRRRRAAASEPLESLPRVPTPDHAAARRRPRAARPDDRRGGLVSRLRRTASTPTPRAGTRYVPRIETTLGRLFDAARRRAAIAPRSSSWAGSRGATGPASRGRPPRPRDRRARRRSSPGGRDDAGGVPRRPAPGARRDRGRPRACAPSSIARRSGRSATRARRLCPSSRPRGSAATPR